MKIIYRKSFPPKDFAAINILGIIIARQEYGALSEVEKNHEKIHTYQIYEMLVIFFYITYFIEWLIRLMQYRNAQIAYQNISYEREAYQNMFDPAYLKKRKYYAFFKYYKKKT